MEIIKENMLMCIVIEDKMNFKKNIILICLLIPCMFVIGCIDEHDNIEDSSHKIQGNYTYVNETTIITTERYTLYIGNVSYCEYNNGGMSEFDIIIFNDGVIINVHRLEYYTIKLNDINIIKVFNHKVSDIKILN